MTGPTDTVIERHEALYQLGWEHPYDLPATHGLEAPFDLIHFNQGRADRRTHAAGERRAAFNDEYAVFDRGQSWDEGR